MQLDVVNSENEKVGAVDLSDEVFGGRVNTRPDLGVGRARERGGAARHARDQEPRARQRQRQEAVAAEGHRPRAGRRRSATRCGGTAARCSGRSRAATTSSCRRRSSAARCARRWRRSCKDGAARRRRRAGGARDQDQGGGGAAEAARRHRQGGARRRRGRREAGAVGAQHSRRLARAERAADRARRRSTPTRVVATRGALEKLQEALADGPRIEVMKLTDVIRRPLITEKTSILREDGRTIVFQVARERQQDRDQARRRAAARLEGRQHPDQHRARQDQAAGPLRRPAVGLEEGLREAARRRRRCPNSWKERKSCRFANSTRRRPGSGFRPCRPSTRSRRTEPHKPLVEPLHSTGGRNNHGAADVVVARRRPQADVPHHRLQARQARHSGEGRRRSSTTRTARRGSRC